MDGENLLRGQVQVGRTREQTLDFLFNIFSRMV